jgi:hypothetical protein
VNHTDLISSEGGGGGLEFQVKRLGSIDIARRVADLLYNFSCGEQCGTDDMTGKGSFVTAMKGTATDGGMGGVISEDTPACLKDVDLSYSWQWPNISCPLNASTFADCSATMHNYSSDKKFYWNISKNDPRYKESGLTKIFKTEHAAGGAMRRYKQFDRIIYGWDSKVGRL